MLITASAATSTHEILLPYTKKRKAEIIFTKAQHHFLVVLLLLLGRFE
jgi:hypothetical protein